MTLLQGCYLESQHRTHSMTYHGRLVDAQTGSAIPQAHIAVSGAGLTASATSATNGTFHVGPLKCYRFGIAIAPEPEVLFPFRCRHYMPQDLDLVVSHRGYEATKMPVPTYGATTNMYGDLDLGEISMRVKAK
jgi:hypothetical protein